MTDLLRSKNRLKTLVYSHAVPEGGPDRDWDVCSFMRLVERETGSQLERLYVETHALPGALVSDSRCSTIPIPEYIAMDGEAHNSL